MTHKKLPSFRENAIYQEAEKSKNMDNLMDCMGLLERAYDTLELVDARMLPEGIMEDINVFKSRMLDMPRIPKRKR